MTAVTSSRFTRRERGQGRDRQPLGGAGLGAQIGARFVDRELDVRPRELPHLGHDLLDELTGRQRSDGALAERCRRRPPRDRRARR